HVRGRDSAMKWPAGTHGVLQETGIPRAGCRPKRNSSWQRHIRRYSSVRKVLQRHFRKFFSIDFISSGLWKCGKAERSSRAFSKPLWESASYADFHSGVISIRPLPFFLFWFFFLSLLLRSSLCEKLFALGSFMGHVHRVG